MNYRQRAVRSADDNVLVWRRTCVPRARTRSLCEGGTEGGRVVVEMNEIRAAATIRESTD